MLGHSNSWLEQVLGQFNSFDNGESFLERPIVFYAVGGQLAQLDCLAHGG